MNTNIGARLLACFILGTSCAFAEGIDVQELLQNELGLTPEDASLYWDGLSWTIASTVAEGKRVAINGLGAFEPAYVTSDEGKLARTLRFAFDLGPALPSPCVETVFEDGIVESLDSFAWLESTGGKPGRRLQGDDWQRLLDAFVFCALRSIDGHARMPLGMDLGHFYPSVDLDLSTERDGVQRRLTADFVADDDSREKFREQYRLSVSLLREFTRELDREVKNLERYARLTGIPAYSVAEQIVARVAAAWQAELDDLNGSRAQDHNSSRSNKTASVIQEELNDLGDAQDALKAAAAQDHNSSRSNKTASAIAEIEGDGQWASETLKAAAQDHNSSRSNKTASKNADFYNDLVTRYDGAYGTRAQDHNSSRSNKTASVVADFEGGPGLETLFLRATF